MTRPMLSSANRSGITLIELLMTLTIMAVLTFASIALVSDTLSESKFEETVQKLSRFKAAILGDPSVKENGVRTSFGYVGDVGDLPSFTNFRDDKGLFQIPGGISAFAMDSTARFGAGWNGPYVQSTSGIPDTINDAWGNEISYDPVSNPPTLTSYGADGIINGSGYDQDIVVSLPSELYKGTVHGFINNKGIPYEDSAEVVLYSADGSGVVGTSTKILVAADKGYFSFNDVPFGKRSVMVYVPNSITPSSTIGPVLFTMERQNQELHESWFDLNP